MLDHRLIAPSVLTAWEKSGGDFDAVGRFATAVAGAGADWLHLDIMDGRFVPAATFDEALVRYLRESVKLPPKVVFDVHLMVQEPELLIPAYLAAGADRGVFHPTSTTDMARCIGMMNDAGRAGGVALDIDEPVELMKHWAGSLRDSVRQVLIMTVKAGAGGQAFMPEMLPKITEVRDLLGDVTVVVDGGINNKTAPLAWAAGADVVVAGSYVYSSQNYSEALAALRGVA